MSTYGRTTPTASDPQRSSVPTRPSAPVIPTNSVTWENVTVRARIDAALAVEEVVRQLCVSLKIPDPPAMHALRDAETDELVTTENLRRKIAAKAALKLVNAPALEAAELADKLSSREDAVLKKTLVSLQKLIKEEPFANEFLNRDGLRELLRVIGDCHGNALAYALTVMQNLMELDHGWSSLSSGFILKVVQILSSTKSLVNVCRPATAILKRLVEADAMSAPGPLVASSSRGPPAPPPGSVYRYGFDVVFEQMRKERRLLETVVARLSSGDTAMVLYSIMLINSLLVHATDTWWEEFISELERLNVRKAIVRLMSSHTIEDLTSCILDFQANFMRVTYRKKTTLVEPATERSHREDLDFIWKASRLQVIAEDGDTDEVLQWRQLGFGSEDLSREFAEVGVLGLHCLRHFVEADIDFFSKVVSEQISRPPERRCPIAKASNEIVELLSEHWAIYAGTGYSTSTTFQPFFLSFYKVHALAMNFFLRMWNESGSATGDFARVSALVRSQVKVALRRENVRPWHEVEHDFVDSEYRAVRDRQMKELEEEDDLLSKVPVRNLRAKLYNQSVEFVRQQRIHCLLQGAWFVTAVPSSAPMPQKRPSRPWRFLRLDNNMKHLHYVDSALKFQVRSGFEDLPEKIEVALIHEIATGTGVAPPNVLPGLEAGGITLSFSLMNTDQGSLADLIAPDQLRWADWTDGLNMLRRDGGHVTSSETESYVKALTEIGLKIKLLDLSGEKVQIPSAIAAGPPPPNLDYFFSELNFDH